MTPLLINEQEASKLVSMSVSKLQKSRSAKSTLIGEGKAPTYVKADGKVLYRVEDLISFAKNLPSLGAGGKIFVPSLQEKKEPVKKPELPKEERTPECASLGMPEELASACAFLN